MKKLAQVFAGVWLLCAPILLLADATRSATLLVWGDSLSSAYGFGREQGWVALLEERLAEHDITVVNGSISGETTQGGASRLPAALAKHRPNWVILELGGNDGLRATPTWQIEKNLTRMIELSQDQDAEVLLLGMRIPPNYGPAYADAFAALYPRVAKKSGTSLVPFFLEQVATDPSLMQSDGIHPTATAQPYLLDNVWPFLAKLLSATATAGR
ncbi:MAG: arylesterase [Thiotrichales bacterium]